ncbi:MAG: hypothetical protein ACRDQ7_00600 [Haloechinothrix sp.]
MDYPDRSSFGALTMWGKVRRITRFIFRLPLWLFGITLVVLLESTDFDFRHESRPGTVHVDGRVRNQSATQLIDSLSKARGSLLITFSRTRMAFFESADLMKGSTPIWQSPPDAQVRFGPVWPNKISVDWPDGTQAWLNLTDDQHKVIVQFFMEQSGREI